MAGKGQQKQPVIPDSQKKGTGSGRNKVSAGCSDNGLMAGQQKMQAGKSVILRNTVKKAEEQAVSLKQKGLTGRPFCGGAPGGARF